MFEVAVEQEKKIKNNRLPKELKELEENPVNGITIIE
jgi:hypothetical protein